MRLNWAQHRNTSEINDVKLLRLCLCSCFLSVGHYRYNANHFFFAVCICRQETKTPPLFLPCLRQTAHVLFLTCSLSHRHVHTRVRTYAHMGVQRITPLVKSLKHFSPKTANILIFVSCFICVLKNKCYPKSHCIYIKYLFITYCTFSVLLLLLFKQLLFIAVNHCSVYAHLTSLQLE